MRLDDRISGALIVFLGAVVLVGARGIPAVPGTTFGPDLMPTIVGAALAICGATIFVGGARAAGTVPWVDLSDWAGKHLGVVGAVWSVGGTILGILYIGRLGFPIFAFVFALPLMLMMGARLVVSALVAAGVSLTAYAVFVHLLLVPLPAGPLAFLG